MNTRIRIPHFQSLITAVRSLRKTPILSLAAILSLALGIGANAAIFSYFNHALLRQLPVQEPGELVTFSASGPKEGLTSSSSNVGGPEAVFSHPLFRDLERGQNALVGIAAHREISANIAYQGRTSNETALLVSGSYFPVLGLRPALGRLLTEDDDRTPGAHRVVVLSHAYWRSRFGEDPSVLNSAIVINGEPMTVVGVAPRGFEGTAADETPRAYIPLMMSAAVHSDYADLTARRSHWLYLFGRLKRGVSRETAEASMNGVFSGILQNLELPQQTGRLASGPGRAEFLARKVRLADGARGARGNRAELVPVFTLMFSITGIVVLIACANIANLLLARGVSRAAEFAVRLSLGASRGHLMTQLMIESCVLALAGGGAGLVVARWLTDVLRARRPENDTFLRTPEIGVRVALGADAAHIRRMIFHYVGRLTLVGTAVGLTAALLVARFAASLLFGVGGTDAPVMLASVTLVFVVAALAGVIPAFRASRVDPARALRWE